MRVYVPHFDIQRKFSVPQRTSLRNIWIPREGLEDSVTNYNRYASFVLLFFF
jgi:hypothetical protein